MSNNKAIVIGSDDHAAWQLIDFFLPTIKPYMDDWSKAGIDIVVYDFGMSEENIKRLPNNVHLKTISLVPGKTWFNKPNVMRDAAKEYSEVVWVDVDIEILSKDFINIFSLIEDNKLLMAEDKPWTKRRGEIWHNSGVVGFRGRPTILTQWCKAILSSDHDQVGDQEVLHMMVRGGLKRLTYITDMPTEYNWLRIHTLDGNDPSKAKALHWTGPKGKTVMHRKIKEMNNNV